MEKNRMEKRYGLPTAISMVIGIVIGSGIFIKGGKILSLTNGNMLQAIAVILVVGLICIICSLVFASLGSQYENVNGVVDFAEVALGPKYAYFVGWFMTTIFAPTIAAMLAFFSAMMFGALFNIEAVDFATGNINYMTIGIGATFLMLAYGINALSPIIAGKLQVGSTIIKLVPLVLMGVIGTIVGIKNGSTQTVLNFVNTAEYVASEGGFFNAVVGFAFAYEGWIFATSINSELKNAKRNLPLALIIGSVTVTILYALYIFSMSSLKDVSLIIGTWPFGEKLAGLAFANVFGKPFGTLIYVFITISCLGTLNGVVMSSCRSLYSLSVRNLGPDPEFFGDIDKQNNFAIKSSLIGMMLAGFWYGWTTTIWMGGPDMMGTLHTNNWIGWEPDEVCIICLYLMYIPMMIGLMVKAKNLSFIERFVIPFLGLLSCLFFCYSCWVGKGYQQCLGFLIFFTIVELIGFAFLKKGKKK